MNALPGIVTSILVLPIIELVILGALSGIVGTLALLDKKIFFAESLTHGTFPGAVLGVVIAHGFHLGHGPTSIALFIGAALFCLPLGWLMRFLADLPGISSQAAAGIILSFGFALGYFLAKWFAPLPLQVQAFLTGSVLTVGPWDVWAAGAALFLTLLVLIVWGKDLIACAFDPAAYLTSGRNPQRMGEVILALILITVVTLIPAVGTVLSIALLAAPAAGLAPLVSSVKQLMIAAPVAGILIGLGGLFLGSIADLSIGGTISVLAGLFYALCRLLASRGRAATRTLGD